jgi:hypothetical protein
VFCSNAPGCIFIENVPTLSVATVTVLVATGLCPVATGSVWIVTASHLVTTGSIWVATGLCPVTTGSRPVAISVVSRLQLQGGCILHRECTLLHFRLVYIYIYIHICNWDNPYSYMYLIISDRYPSSNLTSKKNIKTDMISVISVLTRPVYIFSANLKRWESRRGDRAHIHLLLGA